MSKLEIFAENFHSGATDSKSERQQAAERRREA